MAKLSNLEEVKNAPCEGRFFVIGSGSCAVPFLGHFFDVDNGIVMVTYRGLGSFFGFQAAACAWTFAT